MVLSDEFERLDQGQTDATKPFIGDAILAAGRNTHQNTIMRRRILGPKNLQKKNNKKKLIKASAMTIIRLCIILKKQWMIKSL